ncbi:hypothetical protein OG417_09135 [Actinoallomurus sp. NBC_01490]|uniref:hypothetical protein n=1 Tax=Actinoallomurus sp. NBC_01490 TaxID=2903557 RepID=UPI002E30AB0E|nr:hypothetical protein [Actinoallomurus sp. NBC_01490]
MTLRLAGAAELAAVLGLLLPGALDLATVLTPPAAAGVYVSPARPTKGVRPWILPFAASRF